MAFLYQTQVLPDWIDYNGHMQDAFYGLVFSYAVDAFQDWVAIHTHTSEKPPIRVISCIHLVI